jgi:hypothetical protein
VNRRIGGKAAALFFALALARLGEAATKDGNAPDREMLKMMELLRQMEMIKELEMLRDLDRLENGATAAPRKAQPSKQPERPK